MSEFTTSLLITCILAEEIHSESSHLPTFGLPWSWPWRWIQIKVILKYKLCTIVPGFIRIGWPFKIHFPNVNHFEFEGHVMPNEDIFQKSVWKNVDIVWISEFTISCLIMCILTEEIDFLQLANIHDLELGLGHMAYHLTALTGPLPTYQI